MEKEEYKEIFEAVVEIDETYVGGKPRKVNRHSDNDKDDANKSREGTRHVKDPIIGVKEHGTGKIHAAVANYDREASD